MDPVSHTTLIVGAIYNLSMPTGCFLQKETPLARTRLKLGQVNVSWPVYFMEI